MFILKRMRQYKQFKRSLKADVCAYDCWPFHVKQRYFTVTFTAVANCSLVHRYKFPSKHTEPIVSATNALLSLHGIFSEMSALSRGCTSLPKIWNIPQNSRHQKGEMDDVSC